LVLAIDEAVSTSDNAIEWAVCHQTITTLASSQEGNLQALQVPRTRDNAWSARCDDARMAGRQRIRRSVDGPVTREAVAGALRSLVPVEVDNPREPREVSVMLQIEFELNSAELSPQAMRQLDQVAAALIDAEMVDVPVTIEGHADAIGAKDYNRRLSQARADTALAYLISRGGVAGERLQAIGYGSDRLLLESSPTDARQRRVEIVFTF
jgi:outer membrane protein OmpA-like peptidoglycan-associated protein